ncbi:hypothetical protein FRB96_007557 [Tulasnella sp. 330]|nr:hypothetical protein FRB96_007557 [Tulasnella sp. 330]
MASLILQSCGINLLDRFEQESLVADLEASLRHFEMARSLSGPRDQLQPFSMYKYAVALLLRFKQNGDAADLDRAIAPLEEVLKTQPESHPLRPLVIKTLAEAHCSRSESSTNISNLDAAIQYTQQVLTICPPGDPELAVSYTRLATTLMRRFRVTSSVPDLDDALRLYRNVLEIRAPGHLERWTTLADLSKALRLRYSLLEDREDLHHAVVCEREAWDLSLSNQSNQTSKSQNRVTDSRTITLAAQFLDHHSVLIEADRKNRIGQLKEMIQDKTGMSVGEQGLFLQGRFPLDEWTIEQCIPITENIIYIVNITKPMHATPPENNVLLPIKLGSFSYSQGEQKVGEIADRPSRASQDEDVIPLVTPNVPRENAQSAFEMAIEMEEMGFPKEDVIHTVLEHIPLGGPRRPGSLYYPADTSRANFMRDGDYTELDASIAHYQQALELRPPSHPKRSFWLDNLANALLTRFHRAGDRMDLDSAIRHHQEALQLRPPEDPDRSSSLNNLAGAIRVRFDQFRDRADLQAAIECFQEALELCPSGDLRRSAILDNLAAGMQTRFNLVGDRVSLDKATECYQEVLGLYPTSHPQRLRCLSSLANALLVRFQKAGNRADLDAAIRHHQEALQCRPPGHPSRSVSLNNLASAIQTRFDQVGDRADLHTIIEYFQEALELCPSGHPHRPISLNNLAKAMQTRSNQVGNLASLDTAIVCYQEALELSPPGHPRRSVSLNNLASAIKLRFDRVGDRIDLNTATKFYKEALELCPPGNPHRPARLNNLANALKTGFDLIGNLANLHTAITYYQEALELSPPGHFHRSTRLNNLATAMHARFGQGGDRADFDTAIEYYQEALKLYPPGHSERLYCLSNLANALSTRFDLDRDSASLDMAIRSHEDTLELRPPGHPDRPASLYNLGIALMIRRDQAGDAEDIERVVSLFEDACLHEHGSLELRCQTSLEWIGLALQSKHPSALRAFTAALELLDTFVTMSSSLGLQHIQFVNSKIGIRARTLASDAAAFALDEKQPQRAIELLEQGRGILLAQLVRHRTVLDDLRDASPALAAELMDLSSQLEHSVNQNRAPRMDQDTPESDVIGRHHKLSRQWTNAVSRIRLLSGFSTFLKPTPFDALSRAADKGPVILVNISKLRSDAIILRDGTEPEVVNLPDVGPIDILDICTCMAKALDQSDPRLRASGIDEVLRLLWELVVRFVVERLKELGLPGGSRIWWCPTSWLCLLPLHAAGIYRPKQPRLPDMFVSSYTPTLSALIRARSRPSSSVGRPSILAIGVPEPDGRDGADGILQFVGEELRRLLECVSDAELMKGQDATHDAVLEQLLTHSWVHLSCHGHQDIQQPFQSRFRLQDKPLHMQEIIRKNLPDADLAFLSACHTATGDRNTPDEGLHLAAAMQFAGFKGVVGTLWAMDDIDGPEVTETFYKYMYRNGGEAVNYEDGAKGVHEVSKALRKKKVPVDRWWKLPALEPPETGKKAALLDESSFATLFPKYREKYLREVWPIVTTALEHHSIACMLDLINGSMSVRTTRKTYDPFIILKARDLIKLLARGVPVNQSIKILDDAISCDIIKIGNMVSSNDRFVKRRQRIVGPEGSTLKAIELLTSCYVLVQGNTVAVMGPYKSLGDVRRIVLDCMKNIHPIYRIKELMIRRELAKDPKLAGESWDRFLPKFKKRNLTTAEKSAKKRAVAAAAAGTGVDAEPGAVSEPSAQLKVQKKEKKPYTPFPPAPTPRKVDLQMETGEYWLKRDVRAARKEEEKFKKQVTITAQRKAEKERRFQAPEEAVEDKVEERLRKRKVAQAAVYLGQGDDEERPRKKKRKAA